ncbi:hypothetical protein ABZ942_38370 [Nocardia sp. NPDC046473]|uniref:hypothetical protein n=1 Tax=Nocardia sp. NPDC046473 TaxID=3155733 RepID=UPI0033D5FFAC
MTDNHPSDPPDAQSAPGAAGRGRPTTLLGVILTAAMSGTRPSRMPSSAAHRRAS